MQAPLTGLVQLTLLPHPYWSKARSDSTAAPPGEMADVPTASFSNIEMGQAQRRGRACHLRSDGAVWLVGQVGTQAVLGLARQVSLLQNGVARSCAAERRIRACSVVGSWKAKWGGDNDRPQEHATTRPTGEPQSLSVRRMHSKLQLEKKSGVGTGEGGAVAALGALRGGRSACRTSREELCAEHSGASDHDPP